MLTVAQCQAIATAEGYQLTESAIRQALQQQRLKGSKFGRDWAIREYDFRLWLFDLDNHKPGRRSD